MISALDLEGFTSIVCAILYHQTLTFANNNYDLAQESEHLYSLAISYETSSYEEYLRKIHFQHRVYATNSSEYQKTFKTKET